MRLREQEARKQSAKEGCGRSAGDAENGELGAGNVVGRAEDVGVGDKV